MRKGSGKEFFFKYPKLISFFCNLIRCFPKPFKRFLWDILNIFSGKFSLLMRYALLKDQAEKVGDNVYVAGNVTINNAEKLKIGSNVSIHTNCYIDAYGGCVIGDNVSIAHSTSIISFDHSWDDLTIPIKYNIVKANPVVISNDVWIGCGVRVLSGATIESRCVIAAGSVVKGSLSKGALYGGIPAHQLKKIN